ncbi:MAG: beta-ketoacyl synthase N-terminal-like domain-containing protein [Kibdelosporangium sp.]
MGDIAIIGIDGRFPGAPDPAAYWDLLVRGEAAICEVPRARWDGKRLREVAGGEHGGFIADADAFDHDFFGISPREAEAMDPQQRLTLQSAWRALQDACLDPRAQAGTATGVFIGVMGAEWAHTAMADPARISPYAGSGNGHAMIANRISYHLDLIGPSISVDTACSSSLVAIHQACAALRDGECDQALAGGVNIMVSPALNVFYGQAGLAAADGACKPFSEHADGIVRSEAVGTVVLRRVEDVGKLPVYAVIKGSAVNHNGRSNGLAAPNRRSQRAVLAEAYRRAGVSPADIVAIEAHGTGTVLGDMIEVNALGDVHTDQREQPLAIGAVKGNIGHTEGAAGIASVIKMALALCNRVVPASRHARTENPRLKLQDKKLRLLKAPLRLARDAVVGVSSFGLGGTNAHLVLAAPPSVAQPVERLAPGVLTVSGNSPAAVARNAGRLARDIAAAPERRLGRICWTTNQVKASGRHRLAVVATSREQAIAALTGGDPVADGVAEEKARTLAAAAESYREGHQPDWDELYDEDQRVPYRLTPYEFSTESRFWTKPLELVRPVETPARRPDDVATGVLEILADVCGYQPHEVSQDSKLYEDLGFDSLMVTQLKERVERHWGQQIGLADLAPELTRARDLIRFVRDQIVAPDAARVGGEIR